MTLELVGEGVEVPLVQGGTTRYLNFDSAASTPALEVVQRMVNEFLPWYASVHRGQGFKSQIASDLYDAARDILRDFVGGREDDVVIFTRNTTDSLNLLASALPKGSRVITLDMEHHANLLPWRQHDVVHLTTPRTADQVVADIERAAASSTAATTMVAVTGVSNVTGEILPIDRIVAAARRHGAYVVIDGAQLAPHAPIDLRSLDADWIALSGHKMYAPFGVGALIGRRALIGEAEPFLRGGGAVEFVTTDGVWWSNLPERQESGSPNVVGAVAMAGAARELKRRGMKRIAADEHELGGYARQQLSEVPGLHMLQLFSDQHPRIGVITFIIDGLDYRQVSTALSAEHGIALRDGCFCAHPLMLRLLDVPEDRASWIRDQIERGNRSVIPGAVRMSLNVASRPQDVDRIAIALHSLATAGPQWNYVREPGGRFRPAPDRRFEVADLPAGIRTLLGRHAAGVVG